jgi:acetyl esterase/lipase
MKSRPLLHPELAQFLDYLPVLNLSPATLPAVRQRMIEGVAHAAPQPANVTVEPIYIPGRGGAPDVRALVYRPNAAGALPALLHFHGGGYVGGIPEIAADRNGQLAQGVGCVVVSVDYRLSPETRYPGPLEDCYTALLWLHRTARQLGIDNGRIAIGGDSAGGGLAAALALLTRDRAEVNVAFQLLTYPMLDDRTGTTAKASPNPYAGEYIWTPSDNRFAWQSLLGHEPGRADISPYAAPARAPELAGLPPAFIGVGSLDLFLSEDVDYAHRLIRAGVATELHVYPGAFHGFDAFPGTRLSAQFCHDQREALCRALHPATQESTKAV